MEIGCGNDPKEAVKEAWNWWRTVARKELENDDGVSSQYALEWWEEMKEPDSDNA